MAEDKKKPLLSVVIPCRNQGSVIHDTIIMIEEHSKKIPYDIELIVSDGNSTDNTNEVLLDLEKKYPKMVVFEEKLTAKGEHGKGNGLKQGIALTKGDLVMFLDADNSTKFTEIDKFLPYIEKYDLVIGTRYSDKIAEPSQNWFKSFWSAFIDVIQVIVYGNAKRYKAVGKQGRWRQFVSRGGNLAFTVLLGQSFSDSRCGFKLFKGDIAREMFARTTIPKWGFDTEIMVMAKEYKAKILEVPVEWRDDAEESNVNLKETLMSFVEIIAIRWNLIRGLYRR
jgi:glycosyltransferase involved in cell wall biosynthesis